jgi:hypothetical protein
VVVEVHKANKNFKAIKIKTKKALPEVEEVVMTNTEIEEVTKEEAELAIVAARMLKNTKTSTTSTPIKLTFNNQIQLLLGGPLIKNSMHYSELLVLVT